MTTTNSETSFSAATAVSWTSRLQKLCTTYLVGRAYSREWQPGVIWNSGAAYWQLTRHSLELQGFHAKETLAIFSPVSSVDATPCFGSLERLNIAVAGGHLSKVDAIGIVRGCPLVRILTITALTWKCEWVKNGV